MLIDAAGLRAYIGAILSETEAGGVMEMPVSVRTLMRLSWATTRLFSTGMTGSIRSSCI